MIEAYEKAQEPADWSWLLELGIGLASNLNPVLKGIDLALTLRDVFMTGNMLALGGLVDFIPPSFFRAAGRFLSRLPGTNTIRRLGNDMGAWVDDLARRFGRGAEGKLRFAGADIDEIDSNIIEMSGGKKSGKKGKVQSSQEDYEDWDDMQGEIDNLPSQSKLQNEQVKRVAELIKEEIGTPMTFEQIDRLHRAISHQYFSFEEILDIAREIMEGRR